MDPAFTKRIFFRGPVNRFISQSLQELNMNAIKKFIRDEEGVTAIEYGLLAAFVALAIITAATDLGKEIAKLFGKITTKLSGITF